MNRALESPTEVILVRGFHGKDGEEDSRQDGIPMLREAIADKLHCRVTVVSSVFPGDPNEEPRRVIARLQGTLRRRIADVGRVTTFTHSYGGPLLLATQCDLGFQGIERSIYADGPFDPDEEVRAIPQFEQYGVHYRQRPTIMRRSMAQLRRLREEGRLPPLLTMGSSHDLVVPPRAKQIEGVPHVSYPPRLRGHRLDDEKIEFIADTITTQMQEEQSQKPETRV